MKLFLQNFGIFAKKWFRLLRLFFVLVEKKLAIFCDRRDFRQNQNRHQQKIFRKNIGAAILVASFLLLILAVHLAE